MTHRHDSAIIFTALLVPLPTSLTEQFATDV